MEIWLSLCARIDHEEGVVSDKSSEMPLSAKNLVRIWEECQDYRLAGHHFPLLATAGQSVHKANGYTWTWPATAHLGR